MANLGDVYEFLLRKAKDQTTFSAEDLNAAAGWGGSTAKTYLGKQLKSVIERSGDGNRVRKGFVHLQKADFLKRVSQTESILPSYRRSISQYVVNYEFLMPLTREGLLRSELDNLFYRDTLESRIQKMGPDRFKGVIPARTDESEGAYCSRVAREVARYIGGYSITHVNGRFRADALVTQKEAVGRRYIVDETTALVRFIVPLYTGNEDHGDVFGADSYPRSDPPDPRDEISRIRALFISIFAEVVVHAVQGKDEIWLLETFAGVQRLYRWEVLR